MIRQAVAHILFAASQSVFFQSVLPSRSIRTSPLHIAQTRRRPPAPAPGCTRAASIPPGSDSSASRTCDRKTRSLLPSRSDTACHPRRSCRPPRSLPLRRHPPHGRESPAASNGAAQHGPISFVEPLRRNPDLTFRRPPASPRPTETSACCRSSSLRLFGGRADASPAAPRAAQMGQARPATSTREGSPAHRSAQADATPSCRHTPRRSPGVRRCASACTSSRQLRRPQPAQRCASSYT